MPVNRRAALLAASGAAALALVTACGSSGSSYNNSSPTPAPATTAPSSPSTPAAGAGLMTSTSTSLGTIVTDGNGFTLYRFDKDATHPSVSNCNGSCSSLWPPAPSVDKGKIKGVDPALVGTLTRADGTTQLTLNGSPLYRYAPDTKPGDTKGEGFGGLWFASTPTGQKATAQPPATKPPATSPSTGGYGY